MSESARCAAHPGRPARDHCPICGRPRCAADAAQADAPGGAGGCRRCACRPSTATGRPVAGLVAAAVAAQLVALVGGWVSSQYVGTRVFSWLVPALVGVGCGAAATWAARLLGSAGSPERAAVRVLAAGYAVLGTGCGFRFVVGGDSALHPAGQVLPAYAAAALGAWLWTLPPRRGRRTERDQGAARSGRAK